MTTLHRLLAAFLPRTPRAGEKWLALTMVAWGAWLLLPFSTFTAGLATTLLARTMSEEAWGTFGVVLGVAALIIQRQPWPRLRVLMSALLTVLWFFLAAVTLSVSSASSVVLYLMLGLRQATYLYEDVLDWRGGVWTSSKM
jgi:hypothetical protein